MMNAEYKAEGTRPDLKGRIYAEGNIHVEKGAFHYICSEKDKKDGEK